MSAQDMDNPTLGDGAEQATDTQDSHCAVAGEGQVDPNIENNWAARNPMKDIIPTQACKKRTEAQLASRALITKANKASRAFLMQDIDAFLDGQANLIKGLAEKHSVKPEYIKKLVNPITTYKKKRIPTLPNAIAHVKAMEINQGQINV